MIVFFLPCARGERESFLCLSPLEEEICRGHSSPGFSLDVLSSLALSFLPTQLSPAHTAVSVLRFTALLTSPTRERDENSDFFQNACLRTSLDVLSSLALSFLPTQLSPAHTAVSVLRFTALLTSPTRAKREKSQFSKNV